MSSAEDCTPVGSPDQMDSVKFSTLPDQMFDGMSAEQVEAHAREFRLKEFDIEGARQPCSRHPATPAAALSCQTNSQRKRVCHGAFKGPWCGMRRMLKFAPPPVSLALLLLVRVACPGLLCTLLAAPVSLSRGMQLKVG